MVVSAFHMLVRQEPDHELGVNYFDEHWQHHMVDRLARRIEQLDYHVTLDPQLTAAT
jgi:hypothetical protein